MGRAATPAIGALIAAGINHEVFAYRHDPRNPSFGAEAAAELGRDHGFVADQIFKTLVLALPAGLAVAVLPVPQTLSLKAAAAALGVRKAALAPAAEAQRSTGYVLGGISPLGQRTTLPTVIDSSALNWSLILCSAGKRGLDIALAPQDLIDLSDAVLAEIVAR